MVAGEPGEREGPARGPLPGSPGPLPLWPLAAMLLGLPAWWLLGVSLLAWPAFAAAMAWQLLPRRAALQLPRAFALWLAFIGWMLLSGLALLWTPDPSPEKYAGNALLYLSATVTFVYAYALARDPARRRGLLKVGAAFWAIVALGGLFAVLVPGFSITTPMQRLLPDSAATNPFVAHRITADATVEAPIGDRPRAPLGEVNEWGSTFLIALPFAFALLLTAARAPTRIGLLLLLEASLVPLVLSRNRGVWLILALLAAYALIRALPALRRAPPRALATGVAAVAVAVAIIALTPLGGTVAERAGNEGGGDADRAASYGDALSLAVERPLLGHATTQPVDDSSLPAGTHGHALRLVVSHGIPALLLVLGWLLLVAWRTRRGPPEVLCAHAVVLAGLLAMAFYNLLPGQLHVIMLAAAIGLATAPRSAPTEHGSARAKRLARTRHRAPI